MVMKNIMGMARIPLTIFHTKIQASYAKVHPIKIEC